MARKNNEHSSIAKMRLVVPCLVVAVWIGCAICEKMITSEDELDGVGSTDSPDKVKDKVRHQQQQKDRAENRKSREQENKQNKQSRRDQQRRHRRHHHHHHQEHDVNDTVVVVVVDNENGELNRRDA